MRRAMRRSSVLALAFILGVALVGSTAPGCGPAGGAAQTGICAEHHVLEADCPFCHKDLVAKLGMCKEHGVPEALCWICKPSLGAADNATGDG